MTDSSDIVERRRNVELHDLQARVAVLEAVVKDVKGDVREFKSEFQRHDEREGVRQEAMLSELRKIQEDMLRHKGFVGGVVFIVTSLVAAVQLIFSIGSKVNGNG